MPNGTAPTTNVLTTTNQYLAGYWMDLVLRDNYFFGKVMQKEMRKSWRGSQALIPKLYGYVKSVLIYGEVPNYAIA